MSSETAEKDAPQAGASPSQDLAHDSAENPVERAAQHLVDAVKPHLRGWIHLGMTPLALAAGIVLIALAPSGRTCLAAAVFAATAVTLFGTSALYHRWRWDPRVQPVLKRMDHANIFLIIAGTYTPLALLLPRSQATTLLTIVWTGAVLGILFRVFWHHAPRWLYTPLYVALGWVAVFYLAPLLRLGGVALVVLVIVGGGLYTLGALVYALKRPNPSPRWFGFHEIFHVFTIAAFVTHYIAVSLAVYGVTPRGVI